MTLEDLMKTSVDVLRVFAKDWYFQGPDNNVKGLTITPGGEHYFVITKDLGPNQNRSITAVSDLGTFDGNTHELGLILFTNADRGHRKRGGATQDTLR